MPKPGSLVHRIVPEGFDCDEQVLGLALPYPRDTQRVCMTFRHRHGRRGKLIETAEVEPGKAEAGQRKKQREEDA